MSHEFESGFVVHKPAWHGLATVLNSPPTAEEAIRYAGLDWEVSLEPVFTKGQFGAFQGVPDYFATVRSKDRKPLGIVGKRYEPVQNVQAFRFFDPFIESGEATYHTAGSLKEGKLIWVLAKLNQSAEVVPGDRMESYLLFSTSHDGSQCVGIQFTHVRVVCWNTLSMAQGKAEDGKEARLRVSHTKSVHSTLEQIQGVVNASKQIFEANLQTYMELAARDINQDDLRKYVRVVLRDINLEDEEKVKKETEEKVRGEDNIISLFRHSQANNIRGMRNSWWAAFNSITEYVDHERGKKQENRVYSSLIGAGSETKKRALETALTMSRS